MSCMHVLDSNCLAQSQASLVLDLDGWMDERGIYRHVQRAAQASEEHDFEPKSKFCKPMFIQVYYIFYTLGLPFSDHVIWYIHHGYWSSSSCFVVHISHRFLMCVRYQPECVASSMLPIFLHGVGVALLPAPPSCMVCSRRSQLRRRATCGSCHW